VTPRGTALLAFAALAVAGALAGGRWVASRGEPPVQSDVAPVGASRVSADPDARAPEGVRIRVQVLNATESRGLARRATMMLRDRGFDVVATGTSRPLRDSSVVLDLTGHPDWASRVARAIGGARVEARPDTSRYLDVTVLLGASWRPPAEPFYP